MKREAIIYQARLHVVIFLWPVVLFGVAFYLVINYSFIREASLLMCGIALIWGLIVLVRYQFSILMIKEKQVMLKTGFWVRQTIDVPLSKIESIDIKQPLLGSLLHYGSLVITGTGGTRQIIHYISRPLTCRRHIEQLMQAPSS